MSPFFIRGLMRFCLSQSLSFWSQVGRSRAQLKVIKKQNHTTLGDACKTKLIFIKIKIKTLDILLDAVIFK